MKISGAASIARFSPSPVAGLIQITRV